MLTYTVRLLSPCWARCKGPHVSVTVLPTDNHGRKRTLVQK